MKVAWQAADVSDCRPARSVNSTRGGDARFGFWLALMRVFFVALTVDLVNSSTAAAN